MERVPTSASVGPVVHPTVDFHQSSGSGVNYSDPVMTDRIVTLDVRDDIREGREPFSRIMGAVASLGPDQSLLLIAPFEPVPLYRTLGREGFSHRAHPRSEGNWEILFSRASTEPVGGPIDRPQVPPVADGVTEDNEVEVDARGLEPPQPLVTILEALSLLRPGGTLQARTDRRPMHLYSHLEERGFTGETIPQPDGSFLTRIQRR